MSAAVKRKAFSLLTGGRIDLFMRAGESRRENYIEEAVRYSIFNVTLFLIAVWLTGFGISVILLGEMQRGLLDIIAAFICLATIILLRTRLPFMATALIAVIPLELLCVYLFMYGGNRGFAALWIYAFPIASAFILGMKAGILLSLILFFACAAVIMIPGLAYYIYPLPIVFRLLGVYVLIFILTIVYEYLRLIKDRWIKRLTDDLQEERDEIAAMKDNLNVGLFLISREFIIQPQYSRALEDVFSDSGFSGRSFLNLLSSSLQAKEIDTVKDYLEMMFARSHSQKLMEEINPLHEFKYLPAGKPEKTLRCRFALVDRGSGVFILVTVQDITVETELRLQFAEEQNKRQEEMNALFEIIRVDPVLFPDFIEDTEEGFQQINDILKDKALSARDAIVKIYQLAHAIKSDAVILGLDSFAGKVHALETMIKTIREKEVLFSDMLLITIEVQNLMKEKDSFSAIVDRIASFRGGLAERNRLNESILADTLAKASGKMAAELGKEVRFAAADIGLIAESNNRLIKDILTQLVRNAVYHGIEAPEDRIAAGKDAAGLIQLSVKRTGTGISILFEDDGRGIDFTGIAARAQQMGLIQDNMPEDKRVLTNAIFYPGFSTSTNDEGGLYAGRGVGLSLVKSLVLELSGQLRVKSKNGRGTIFRIDIPSAIVS
ncbi:MAG: Hpt domain-containing protein [Spirochaetia bacterium]|nr:Hpt domain-containing protein [Spirochaetia bacterium]